VVGTGLVSFLSVDDALDQVSGPQVPCPAGELNVVAVMDLLRPRCACLLHFAAAPCPVVAMTSSLSIGPKVPTPRIHRLRACGCTLIASM
jgi:hypothetical protein